MNRRLIGLWILAMAAGLNAADADGKLRIIAFGAHPDDAEYRVGGAAMQWVKLGHKVKLVSVTNGDIGHWRQAGGPLAQRRLAEVQEVARRLGAEVQVLDIHDGELEPTLENRRKITRLIREWKADVVVAHRPWDYHPDHRYVGVLVQDAAFMVTVPFFETGTPALKNNPLFLYSADRFQKPYPFRADIVVAIDEVFDRKVKALSAMESQIFEGGANGDAELVAGMPKDENGKLEWLTKVWQRRSDAKPYRKELAKWYGERRAAEVKYVEAFEICEYGRQPTEAEVRKLFPFFPAK